MPPLYTAQPPLSRLHVAQAVTLCPDWPEGHITLARVQLNFGEPLLALRSYQAAATLQPQHPDLVSCTVLGAQ
jgi:cytochrome c-type biogenesis protein CcmH/NrfG